MRKLKILSVIFLIGLAATVFERYNLQKYYKEVVLMREIDIGMNSELAPVKKEQQLKELNQQKRELTFQQNAIEVLFWVCLVGLFTVAPYTIYKMRPLK